jgi:hypothetical protein
MKALKMKHLLHTIPRHGLAFCKRESKRNADDQVQQVSHNARM